MKSKVLVRPATAMDSVNIVRMLKAQHAESQARFMAPFDEQRMLDFVSKVIAKAGFAIVAEAVGRLLGTAALAPVPLPWCDKIGMMEAWFAVVPKCREQPVPGLLLDELGRFLDSYAPKVGAIFGSNLIAPPGFDKMLAQRKDLMPGRMTYVRAPAVSKRKEAA